VYKQVVCVQRLRSKATGVISIPPRELRTPTSNSSREGFILTDLSTGTILCEMRYSIYFRRDAAATPTRLAVTAVFMTHSARFDYCVGDTVPGLHGNNSQPKAPVIENLHTLVTIYPSPLQNSHLRGGPS
jgi:hypothetical protein